MSHHRHGQGHGSSFRVQHDPSSRWDTNKGIPAGLSGGLNPNQVYQALTFGATTITVDARHHGHHHHAAHRHHGHRSDAGLPITMGVLEPAHRHSPGHRAGHGLHGHHAIAHRHQTGHALAGIVADHARRDMSRRDAEARRHRDDIHRIHTRSHQLIHAQAAYRGHAGGAGAGGGSTLHRGPVHQHRHLPPAQGAGTPGAAMFQEALRRLWAGPRPLATSGVPANASRRHPPASGGMFHAALRALARHHRPAAPAVSSGAIGKGVSAAADTVRDLLGLLQSHRRDKGLALRALDEAGLTIGEQTTVAVGTIGADGPSVVHGAGRPLLAWREGGSVSVLPASEVPVGLTAQRGWWVYNDGLQIQVAKRYDEDADGVRQAMRRAGDDDPGPRDVERRVEAGRELNRDIEAFVSSGSSLEASLQQTRRVHEEILGLLVQGYARAFEVKAGIDSAGPALQEIGDAVGRRLGRRLGSVSVEGVEAAPPPPESIVPGLQKAAWLKRPAWFQKLPRSTQSDLQRNPAALDPARTAAMKEAVARYRNDPGAPRRIDAPGTPDVKVRGGTVALAQTDIEGLEGNFPGASSEAVPANLRGTAGTTEGSVFRSANPTAIGHGEHASLESVRASIDHGLATGALQRQQLVGRTVFLYVEQPPCSSCTAGAGGGESGVLQQFSARYPELVLEVRSAGTSRAYIYHGGTLLNP